MSSKAALQAILLHFLPSEEVSTGFARCLTIVQSNASDFTQGPWTPGPEHTTKRFTQQGKTAQAPYQGIQNVILTTVARLHRAAGLMT